MHWLAKLLLTAIVTPPAISTLVAVLDATLPRSSVWLKVRSLWIPHSTARSASAEAWILANITGKWSLDDIVLSDGRTMRTLECERLQVEGDDAGIEASEEVPVVMLHGFGSALGMWFAAGDFPILRSKHRVYALDWPGWGRSSRHHWSARSLRAAEDYFVEALEEWRQQKGIPRMRLVAHSLGGYLAAVYSLRYPDHVDRLVLVSPAGVPNRARRNSRLARVRGGVVSWIIKFARWAWNAGFTPQSIIRAAGPLGPRLAHTYITKRGEFDGDHIAQQALAAYFYEISAAPSCADDSLRYLLKPFADAYEPLAERLDELAVPLSFMYGERDWMDWTAADDLRDRLPTEVRVYIVKQSGHYVWMRGTMDFEAKLLLSMEEEDIAPHLQVRSSAALRKRPSAASVTAASPKL
eukprot:PLAT15172.1.p1 GENE.PLAT15172.1~~PLAT15172.1.p1  ORF type:complete len:420 (-),score=164.29 PLAT15172.1:75-1304(-)